MVNEKDDSFPDGINVQKEQKLGTKQQNKVTIGLSRNAIFIIGVIVIAVVSFFGGVQYQKGQHVAILTTASQAGRQSQGGFGGRMGGARSGGFGTVTAVSSDSITISQRSFGPDASGSGTSKTYTINASTAITDNGTTATSSDINTGDTVIIRTSDTTSTVATQITVNPTIGGGGGQQQQPDLTNPSVTDNSASNSI